MAPPPLLLLLLLLAALLLPVPPAAGEEAGCPSSCYCDTQLSVTCDGDTLWQFPEGIPTGVRRLELRSFLIPTLTAGQLSAFTNLTELKASRNRISNVENATFSALSQLVKLDLSQNQLSEVTADTLQGLAQTKNLDLSSNRLSSVEGAFAALSSLEQLTLRSNNLTSLGADTLAGLRRLQYLNVDSNSISSIDVSAFQGLSGLAHLILSKNPLTNLSRLEFFGSRLQYIDVSAIGLTRVPQSLTQYVRDLRLAKNNFTVLRRGDFDSYPYLGLLVLDDSGVRELEEDTLGRHEHLMRLWLNGNLLESVPVSLPPSLKALYLEENRLTALRKNDFQGLSALAQLFMQRNLITTVEDCAFCSLVGLQNIGLQANKIAHLSAGSFSGLTALQSLDLSQNPLVSLEPQAFAPLVTLQSLHLSRLKDNISLPDTLFDSLEQLDKLEMYDSAPLVERVLDSGRLLHGIRGVRHLNVMHNQLRRLRSDLPTLLPRLQLFKLGGSWWNCSDPDILWLTDWMAEGRVHFYSPYSVRCRSPARLMLKSVALLTDTDFEMLPTRSAESRSDSTPAIDQVVTQSVSVANAATTASSVSEDVPPVTTQRTVTALIISSQQTDATKSRGQTTQSSSPATSEPRRANTMPVHRRSTSPTARIRTTTLSTASTLFTTASSAVTSSPSTTSSTPSATAAAASSTPTSATTRRRPPVASTHGWLVPAAPPPSADEPRDQPTAAPAAAPPLSAHEPRDQPTAAPAAGATAPATAPAAAAAARGLDAAREPHGDNYVPTNGRDGGSTMVAVVTSMAAAVGVILVILASAVCLWRYRHVSVYPFTRRRKGSSISYSHQKDEVNILQEEAGCEPSTSSDDGPPASPGYGSEVTSTDSHHGLSNVLYFMAQRGEAPELNGETMAAAARPRPASLLANVGVDACPRAVPDAWATPSPDTASW